MFIVEIVTTEGKVCETYETYEEARQRVDSFPEENLAGMPLIFQELPDGSQRVIRLDRKPLQWHRLPEEEHYDEPLPLSESMPIDLAALAAGEVDDEPLPLSDTPTGQDDDQPKFKVVWIKAEEEEKWRELGGE